MLMFFSVALYASLFLCALGLAYKVFWWLKTPIGQGSAAFGPGQRAAAAWRGTLGALFSAKAGPMLKALVLDGLLQRRSLRHSPLAWVAHALIFWGFTLLLLMHALDRQISVYLLPDYTSTANPYLFLRNLFGLMVLAGVGLVLFRRARVTGLRVTTRAVDWVAMALLGVIILAGFGLEALKILSPTRFQAMVQEYSTVDKPTDIEALQAYWAQDYGLATAQDPAGFSPQTLARGRELHEQDCAACHARPQWAFLSFGLSRAIKPAALPLLGAGLERGLWYVHFLASFLGLALLPWTKFLHLITGPVMLMIRAVSDPRQMDPANLATLRAMELDVCTHCGACSVHCSVAVALKQVPNLDILPSEKLASLRRVVCGASKQASQWRGLREGSYICTSCYRCTRVCPVGINLQDLWFALNEDLGRAGYGPTYSHVRQRAADQAEPSRQQSVIKVAPAPVRRAMLASPLSGTYSNCYRCVTCSNVCPVVRFYERPLEQLDLLPHQIMHALGLGLKEEAAGARMTWACLTCYHCQEACPQGVKVADVLYELRNQAGRAGDASGD